MNSDRVWHARWIKPGAMPQDTAPVCFCFPGYSTTIKDTIRTVLVKLKILAFINIVLAVSIFS